MTQRRALRLAFWRSGFFRASRGRGGGCGFLAKTPRVVHGGGVSNSKKRVSFRAERCPALCRKVPGVAESRNPVKSPTTSPAVPPSRAPIVGAVQGEAVRVRGQRGCRGQVLNLAAVRI